MSQHTVFAIASGKGGVGKTTTTVNLGTALAGAGNEVVIVDVDLGMANLAGFVSLEADDVTLHDVLAGNAEPADAVYPLANGISAVPGGIELDGYADVETEGLGDVVAHLRDQFDFVLLDVGAGVSHETVLPLGLADAVLLVSTPEPAAIQDAEKTVDLAERTGSEVFGLVVTRVHPGSDVSYQAIADDLGLDLLATVPEDSSVRESVYAGKPLVVHDSDSPASEAYRRLAARVLGTTDERGPTHEEPAKGDGGRVVEDADGDGTSQDVVRASIREAENDDA
jgi:septum site-determining protein MinD